MPSSNSRPSRSPLVRRARRRLRAASDVRREGGWRALLGRGFSFLRRQYTHRGGWERQYPRAARRLAPGTQEIREAESRLARSGHTPLMTLLAPLAEGEEKLRVTIESLRENLYPRWELVTVGGGTATDDTGGRVRGVPSEDGILREARGEWLGFVEAGDRLHPAALLLASAATLRGKVDLVYTDEDLRDESGSPRGVSLKPGWAPEMLLSYPYVGRLTLARRERVETGFDGLLPWREGGEYDFLLRAGENAPRVQRIPWVLYHRRRGALSLSHRGRGKALRRALIRRGIEGTVEEGREPATFRVRPRIDAAGKVDIIIATHNQSDRLRRCLQSIRQFTRYPHYEITVVDHESDDPTTRSLLAELPHQVVRSHGVFNFSRLMNDGARRTAGDLILFLNNDTEVTEGWLVALLEAAALPGVGIAGGKLLYPSGEVQHAGLVLGVGKVAGHAFKYHSGESSGYLSSLAVIRNYSAVDGACLLIRRPLFEEVGGFDEDLPWHFQDVDLCLKARELGWRTVFTPYCLVFHEEEASGARPVRHDEVARMESRWGELLADDPLYHPRLTRRREDFDIELDG